VKPRDGLLVAAAAVVLGTLTGAYLLPGAGPAAPSTPVSSRPASIAPTPSPSPTSPSPARSTGGGSGPVDEGNLLRVSDFRAAGLDVTSYPQNGNTAPTSSLTSCTDERKVGARTLADLTGRSPAVMGTWDERRTTDTALEVVAVAESPAQAATDVRQLVAAQTLCQDEPARHWVYGDVRSEDVGPNASASWLGLYPGEQNTTGRAPAGRPPCGGVVVARSGTHHAVLEVFLCADADQLAALARASAHRLG
jgi:hypothetical protein